MTKVMIFKSFINLLNQTLYQNNNLERNTHMPLMLLGAMTGNNNSASLNFFAKKESPLELSYPSLKVYYFCFISSQ